MKHTGLVWSGLFHAALVAYIANRGSILCIWGTALAEVEVRSHQYISMLLAAEADLPEQRGTLQQHMLLAEIYCSLVRLQLVESARDAFLLFCLVCTEQKSKRKHPRPGLGSRA